LPGDGRLGILDYGLMTEITADKRMSFIEFLMHLWVDPVADVLVWERKGYYTDPTTQHINNFQSLNNLQWIDSSGIFMAFS